MNRETLWQYMNKPFWTPIGMVGLWAWYGGLTSTGWIYYINTALLLFALICWGIRVNKQLNKQI